MELSTTVPVNENLIIITTEGLHDGHTVHVTGTLEAPLFSARDVGVLLGLSNIRSSLMSLPPINKVSQLVETSGGKQTCTYLTEAGFYRIVFKSRAGGAVSIQDALIGALQTMRRDVATRQPRYVTSGGAEGTQERDYQLYFERVLKDGHMKNRFGETDITTDRAHIELKRWELYKHALGQLVFYRTSNPRTLSLVRGRDVEGYCGDV